MLRITKKFQLNIVRSYKKSALEILKQKIERNYVSRKYEPALQKFEEKILFNSVLEVQKLRLRKLDIIMAKKEKRRLKKQVTEIEPLPLALNQFYDNAVNLIETDKKELHREIVRNYQKTVFPYSRFLKVDKKEDEVELDPEIEKELELQDEGKKFSKNWLKDYVLYDDSEEELLSQYGSPDLYHPVTNVPCHGCGALLHCKE